MKVQMKCEECGKLVVLDSPGDNVWTVFCSPEHAYKWQSDRTEEEIIEHAGKWAPYDRCQWCGCTLKSGYHEDCPVRELQNAKN